MVQRAKKILYKIEKGEYGLAGSDLVAQTDENQTQVPVQLDLFRRPERMLIDRLKNADISGMTPLEAINFLSELQENMKLNT